jgi:peptidoglycan/LPS O-acetylase OafA/YrhL
VSEDKFRDLTFDGIRAVAVISVLFYHLKVPGFEGGFVGVDIFFLLSGYLITESLINSQGRYFGLHGIFTYLERRFFRIFPALFCVCSISLLTGVVLLPPDLLTQLSSSAIYAIFGLSDLYFFLDSDYFSNNSYLKPLLHTWTLGVEVKFYIFLPFLLLLINGTSFSTGVLKKSIRRNVISILLIIIIVTSWNIVSAGTHSFFLAPFRVNEFLIGVLLFLIKNYYKDFSKYSISKSMGGVHLYNEVTSILGLTFIFLTIVFYDENIIFPGWYVMLPIAGSILLISGSKSVISKILLQNKYMVLIGKSSYSIYLVHWPIIVYFGIWHKTVEFSLLDIVLLSIMSIILGYISYRYIEIPYLSKKFRNLGGAKIYILIIASLLLVASHVVYDRGWSWRLSDHYIELKNWDWKSEQELRNKFLNGSTENFSSNNDYKKVLVVGDSHSGDFYRAFYLNNDIYSNYEFRNYQGLSQHCLYKFKDLMINKDNLDEGYEKTNPFKNNIKQGDKNLCKKNVIKFINLLNYKNADFLIFVYRWGMNLNNTNSQILIEQIPIMNDYISKNKKLAFISRRSEFYHATTMMSDINTPTEKKNTKELKKYFAKSKYVAKAVDDANTRLAIVCSENDILCYNFYNLQCTDELLECELTDEVGKLLYLDANGHFTHAGAKYFGKKMYSGVNLILENIDK